MKNKFFKIIVTVCLFGNYSCKRICGSGGVDYSFAAYSAFYPLKDSIHVGDTVWLKCSIPEKQTDIVSQQQVNFSHATNLGSTLGIININMFQSSSPGAIDNFIFVQKKGRIYTDARLSPNQVKQLDFDEATGEYALLVGVIANKPGSYIFSIGNAVNVQTSSGCDKANFSITDTSANKHLYLFEDKWGALSAYNSACSYCVKVK